MNQRTLRLADRRRQLTDRALAQRGALARAVDSCRPALTLADQTLAVVQYVRSHPGWLIGGIAVLAALRTRRRFMWLGRGWVAWHLLHALRAGRPARAGPPAA